MTHYLSYLGLYLLIGLLLTREMYTPRYRDWVSWVLGWPFFVLRFLFHCLFALIGVEVKS